MNQKERKFFLIIFLSLQLFLKNMKIQFKIQKHFQDIIFTKKKQFKYKKKKE